MDSLRLIEIALASWYLAYAFTSTHGPFDLFDTIRWYLPLGGLTICIICLMPWIALLLWLVPDGIIIWALASAGLALLLHGYTSWRFNAN